MKCLASLIFLIACTGDDSGQFLPILPSSTPPSPAGSQFFRVTGRVCITQDLRDPMTICRTTLDASGFTVTSSGSATSTNTAGDFTVDINTLNPNITVTGNGIVPTTRVIRNPSLQTIVPAVEQQLFDDMLLSTGVVQPAGTGSVVSLVTLNGLPSPGVTAISSPTSPFGPFFDGQTPVNWGLDGTGQRGVIWIPGLVSGSVDLRFQDTLGGETLVGGVQVRNGGVTILDTSLIPL